MGNHTESTPHAWPTLQHLNIQAHFSAPVAMAQQAHKNNLNSTPRRELETRAINH